MIYILNNCKFSNRLRFDDEWFLKVDASMCLMEVDLSVDRPIQLAFDSPVSQAVTALGFHSFAAHGQEKL